MTCLSCASALVPCKRCDWLACANGACDRGQANTLLRGWDNAVIVAGCVECEPAVKCMLKLGE